MSTSPSSGNSIKELSVNLAADAESFCRHFFPEGRKQGNYWQIADVSGAKGSSLTVRLKALGGRKAGSWTDYASGEFGDLIDLLHANQGHIKLSDTLNVCRSFLGETPRTDPSEDIDQAQHSPASDINQRTRRARSLFGIGKPTYRTLASSYLLGRSIKRFGPALRYHPHVFVRPDEESELQQFPALLAKITNNQGITTGVARYFLDPTTKKLAQFENPKRVLGQLFGNAIRFGEGPFSEDLIAGEGLENVLSVGTALKQHDLASCLTANHLSVFEPPTGLKRLWIARDDDEAGEQAAKRLRARVEPLGLWVGDLVPQYGDFNRDLEKIGAEALADFLLGEMAKCGSMSHI